MERDTELKQTAKRCDLNISRNYIRGEHVSCCVATTFTGYVPDGENVLADNVALSKQAFSHYGPDRDAVDNK